jgi:hypothetical protein
MLLYDIWINILIPIIIGPVCVGLKSLYDRWDLKQKNSIMLKNSLKLEKVNNKLKEFYWPLYILLLKDFDLWSKIKLNDKDSNITYSDSDSGLDQDDNTYNYCNYVRKVDGLVIPCRNPVAYNCIDRHGPYCIKHQCYKNKKLLSVINYMCDNNKIISESKEDIIDYNESNIDLELGNNQKFINIVKKKINYEKMNNLSDNSINLSESASASDEISNAEIDDEMKRNIILIIKDNHQKISNIIINNISMAEPKKKIGKQLMKYIKFINILVSENDNINIINPSNYGAPYPKRLLPIIELELFKLQKKYNKIVEDYYYI